ncbi:PGC-1 and ERR-induced regulator in muscle protein 1 [Pungitius pungitius]|uniref:PGC-1 and ERR-induced regulator in muscle protein 1 n=1 Tax=Pungitius pungitius TaxID=134920 RepID=UPI002E0FA6F9
MEDFEYSVEICDRDWECFFAECEASNLLPPSLAGVDDSGMSDIDETGSLLANRLQTIDQTAGLPEADRSIDGPPDCGGSPMERYHSIHAVAGMESVLSGSEEDIHLQCVNVFFERMNHCTGSERLTEPSRARDVKCRAAVVEEEERVSDGKQASRSFWPKNIPKSLSASGETAVCNETTEPVETVCKINPGKKYALGAEIAPKLAAASNFVLQTRKSAKPETRFSSGEELRTETRVNVSTPVNQCRDSPGGVGCSETPPGETCTSRQDVAREDLLKSPVSISKKHLIGSLRNLETVTHVKSKGDQSADAAQMDAARTGKSSSQQSSPSPSIKRKRRKKRRPSVESAESVHGYERKVLVKQSDSEEECSAWRGAKGLWLSEDLKLSCLIRPHKECLSVFPVKPNLKNIQIDYLDQYSRNQHLAESIVTKGRRKETELAENNTGNDRSINASSQTDSSATSPSRGTEKVGKDLQQNIKLRVEELTGWPVVITDGVTGQTETGKNGRNDTQAGSLQQSDKMNPSVICCEDERNPESSTAEVQSIHILSSAESNDPVDVRQSDKLSAAKSVLAVEAGHSGRDEHILRGREAEPQQRLESDGQDRRRDSSTRERPRRPPPASSSGDTKPKEFKTRFCPSLDTSSKVGCAESPDSSYAWPSKHFWAESPTSFAVDFTPHQLDLSLVSHTLSKLQVFSEKNTTADGAELAASQIMSSQSGDPFPCGESIVERRRETRPPTSEDLPTRPSDVTPGSSCCTRHTGPALSTLNINTTDMSGSYFPDMSVKRNYHGDRRETPLMMMEERHKGVGPSEYQSQSASNDTTDSTCEDVIAASEADCEPEKAPDSKHSVFAMSSFWREMEMVTINDILGLRMISKAAPSSSLLPIQESEETRRFAITDSSFFTQLDELGNKDPQSDPNFTETGPGSVVAASSFSSSGVLMSTSSEGAQTKISKNISVRNLHALQSESVKCTRKVQTLQTLDEGGLPKEERFTDVHKQEKASSSTESFGISLTDIFQYLFRGKPSVPSQSVTDNITTFFTDGSSVPETYDRFFSDFDTESFFNPLVPADELVPAFSHSRSAKRNLQFPEAYEHFFASSSSDESSVESDEDGGGPVRVVTRFDRASSAPPISTDMYENFFTDRDLRQSLFWKATLSFRNMTLTGSAVQKQILSNPPSRVAVRKRGRSPGRTLHPLHALGNQHVKFPDTRLYQQPFRCEDLQAVVSNPRLDASLLPLRQSDMCLVCIAFASWVLKTANPQVGDTWKAVLLANVSALSAIRYLRKYVKMEAATSEKNRSNTTSSDS